ncbi:hypothetical protein BCR42DRAFT_398455 [Absidia repens]|uniref:Uncharacterized protein n=1 Tax=Absidia repens TaxID=90262 RepID=A0A1X2HZL9_9FUNG|nr:hypothetical protein BCR42DRAFT_398455 [Absidia repens]
MGLPGQEWYRSTRNVLEYVTHKYRVTFKVIGVELTNVRLYLENEKMTIVVFVIPEPISHLPHLHLFIPGSAFLYFDILTVQICRIPGCRIMKNDGIKIKIKPVPEEIEIPIKNTA